MATLELRLAILEQTDKATSNLIVKEASMC